MYTEEEAKKKWCPTVRFSTFNGRNPEAEAAVNCYDNDKRQEDFTCIASDCMMWRWVYELESKHFESWQPDKRVKTDKGHCGLASRMF
jgi:hypothetical protein